MDYTYNAVVVSIHDGDTLTLDVDLGFGIWHKGMVIRFLGMDAKELKTPEGQEAYGFLKEQLPVGAKVILNSYKDRADKYGGRWLGTIMYGNLSINLLMVKTGHATAWDGKGEKPV